jgi:DNA polymerase-4
MKPRFILHLNVADFAVAVERASDRSLCTRPVIIAPLQAARAAVYDMSDEAYKDGVRKGMLLGQATRICRRARVLAPRFDLYRRAMERCVSEARGYSPLLEYGAGDGHLYLDITGTHRLFGAAPDVGCRLRRRIRTSLDIDPIWSLAGSKLVSKIGSRVVKPAGEYIVADGEEQRFLAPLPLSLLSDLTVTERRRLSEFNIVRIGQLASLSRGQLHAVFGRRAGLLFDLSRGVDASVVGPERIGLPRMEREHIFTSDTADWDVLRGVVKTLAMQLGMELRAARKAARRVGLQLHYTDGAVVARQATVRAGVCDDHLLQQLAQQALTRGLMRRTRVRSIRLICDRLHRQSPQLSLFSIPDSQLKREKLLAALDTVRCRFGQDSVRTASQAVLH